LSFFRFLGGLVRFAARRPLFVLGSAALVFLLSLAALLGLEYDPDLFSLLPADLSTVRGFRALNEEFGNLDRVLVTVELPDGVPVEPYLDWLDALADELERSPEVRNVERGAGDPAEWVEELLPRWVFYLSPEERSRFAELLSESSLDRRAQELRQRLLTPEAAVLSDLWRRDPAGIAEWILERGLRNRPSMAVDWTSGRFLSADHRMVILFVEPLGQPQDVEFDARLAASLKEAVARFEGRWADFSGGFNLPPPGVKLVGKHLVALEEAELIRRDLWWSGLLALGGVMALLGWIYRRKLPLVLVFVPLTFGLAVTLAAARRLLGDLSAVTATAVAVLIGLVNDFILLLYSRYEEERQRGFSLEHALAALAGETGRGVMVGGVTTAGAFLAFRQTSFEGLRELGTVVALGIGLCLVSLWFLLPAMIAWSEKHGVHSGSAKLLQRRRLGAGWLIRLSWRHPQQVLLFSGIALALSLFGILQVRFDASTSALRPASGPAEEVVRAVRLHFGGAPDPTVFLVKAASLEELVERLDVLTSAAKAAVEQGELSTVEGIVEFFPPRKRQQEALKWLEEERASGRLDPIAVEKRMRQALLRHGLQPEGFESGFRLLRQALSVQKPIQLDELFATPQGKILLGRFLRQEEDGWWGAMQVSPPAGWPKREVSPAVERIARIGEPDVLVADLAMLSRQVRQRVMEDAWASATVAVALVVGLLWLDLRLFRAVVLALLPLFFGLLAMGGVFSVLGWKLNLMNVFVGTLLVGVGVDYGVHLFHRGRELEGASEKEWIESLESSGEGILVAALTTALGFSALSTSHYPGLVSMGQAAVVGVLSCVWFALTLVPALFARKHAWQRASSGFGPS
jgi:hypothetical protein